MAWLFTRDTNAITALSAVAVSVVLWRVDRCVRRHRWALVLAGTTLLCGGFTLWSAGVRPSQPTGLTLHAAWQPAALARGTFSMVNVVVYRVLPQHNARTFFAQHGLPLTPDLERNNRPDRPRPAARACAGSSAGVALLRRVPVRSGLRHIAVRSRASRSPPKNRPAFKCSKLAADGGSTFGAALARVMNTDRETQRAIAEVDEAGFTRRGV